MEVGWNARFRRWWLALATLAICIAGSATASSWLGPSWLGPSWLGPSWLGPNWLGRSAAEARPCLAVRPATAAAASPLARRREVVVSQYLAPAAELEEDADDVVRPRRLPPTRSSPAPRRLPRVDGPRAGAALSGPGPSAYLASDARIAVPPGVVEIRSNADWAACSPGRKTQAADRAEKSPDPLQLLPRTLDHHWNEPTSSLPAAAQQAAQAVRRASGLARRGATHTAVRELETALETIAEALDRHYGTDAFLPCLRQGLLAIEEVSDFSPPHSGRRANLDVAAIASRHRSQVLTAEAARELTAGEAARAYYAYAQLHLAAATGGAPIAAHAIYGLGKLYLAISPSEADTSRTHGPRSMVMHQTALFVDATHASAANELGVLLARFGRLIEAREALQHGIAVGPLPETWRNLADVHERLGESALAQQARFAWQRSEQLAPGGHSQPVAAPNGMTVRWVDKATFERSGLNHQVPSPGSSNPGPAILQPTTYMAVRPEPPRSTASQPSHPAIGRW